MEPADDPRAELERLRSRRSVRAALGLAAFFRPVFRLVRRARAGTAVADVAAPLAGGSTTPARLAPVAAGYFDRLRTAPAVTVVIPVFNAADDVARCLASVMADLPAWADVLVVDDASTDPAIRPLLADAAADARVTVRTQSANRGFVRTVNEAFAATSGDVVVLNSDTEVPARWLQRLRQAAYEDATIGTVTPLSDNAGVFSVDVGGDESSVGLDAVARSVAQAAGATRPPTPTAHGFCMYVKRQMLDAVGGFDAENFPVGYGEENDLCVRAGRLGWRHVIDDTGFVRHRQGASFGSARAAGLERARSTMARLHPDYESMVAEFLGSPALSEAKARAAAAVEAARSRPPLPRVLIVLHGVPAGGTKFTTLDLMAGLDGRYEPWLFQSDGHRLVLSRIDENGEVVEVESIALETPMRADTTTHPEYLDRVAALCVRLAVEVLHVRHFIHHTPRLVEVAEVVDVPVVVSLHDYYTVCPTIQLLDENLQFCGGSCTPGQGACRIDWDWTADLPHLKHAYVNTWRAGFGEALARADALVTTSDTARSLLQRAHSEAASVPFPVIEHGRDLLQVSVATAPELGGPIRILVPGDVREHKGGRVIQELHRLDRDGRLEFVVMGTVSPPIGTAGRDLGPYERDRFAELAEQVQPHFVGIFSVWAETYSHTLSEAWAAGIPVLAFDFGAVAERLRTWGGGWILDHDDLSRSCREIIAIADDTARYEAGRSRALASNLRSVAAMAGDYVALYDGVRTGSPNAQGLDRR